jgi:hypothetical protein
MGYKNIEHHVIYLKLSLENNNFKNIIIAFSQIDKKIKLKIKLLLTHRTIKFIINQ